MTISDEMIIRVREAIRQNAPKTDWPTAQEENDQARAVIVAALSEAPASAAEPERQKLLGIGMAMGASVIMQGWGDTVQAKEILGAAGFNSEADLVAGEVDEYDINLLRPIFAPG